MFGNLILKVSDQEKKGWLKKEHIREFPCQDLHTIDTLWVKYSQGHFGLSVQKQIPLAKYCLTKKWQIFRVI
ncbi:MAG: hypothetical protein C4322_22685, partial [Mastigocladus sp. ERB_26_1]